MSIIDIHTHPPFYGHEEAELLKSAEEMFDEMDASGLDRCGLLGHFVSPYQSEESVRSVNDHTLGLVKLHPDRFFGYAFVNPANDPAFIAEELDRCLSTKEFRGIKLEVCVNSRSQLLDLVMQKSIEHGKPVLQHTWYLNLWSTKDERALRHQANRSEPHDVADMARRFPEARIIMAHMEGSGPRGIIDIEDLPNVWLDTSGSQPFSGTLEFALSRLGSERIVYGSDLMGRGLGSQLGRIYGTCLSEHDKKNILELNARRLFNL